MSDLSVDRLVLRETAEKTVVDRDTGIGAAWLALRTACRVG
jgi:hypothetical protein